MIAKTMPRVPRVPHIPRTLLLAAASVALLAFVGCAKSPAPPADTFYRLPPTAAQTLASPVTDGPLLIQEVRAEGLYRERMIVYTEDSAPQSLHAHPYQLWLVPTARLLQDHLVAYLRDARAASLVIDKSGTSVDPRAVKIRMTVRHLEQRLASNGASAEVAMEFRAEGPEGDARVFVRDYRANIPARDTSVEAAVAAMGAGLKQIYDEFARDLAAERFSSLKAPSPEIGSGSGAGKSGGKGKSSGGKSAGSGAGSGKSAGDPKSAGSGRSAGDAKSGGAGKFGALPEVSR